MEWMAFVLTILLALVPAGDTTAGDEAWMDMAPPETAVEIIDKNGETDDPEATEETKGSGEAVAEQKGNPSLAYATDAAIAWADEFDLLWQDEEQPFSYEVTEIMPEYDYPTLVWGYVGEAISMDFYISLSSGEYWCIVSLSEDDVPLRQAESYRKLFSNVVATTYAAYYEDMTKGQFAQLEKDVDAIAEQLLQGSMRDGDGADTFYFNDSYVDVDYDADWQMLECYICF